VFFLIHQPHYKRRKNVISQKILWNIIVVKRHFSFFSVTIQSIIKELIQEVKSEFRMFQVLSKYDQPMALDRIFL